jgi:hypothetical protein
MLVELTVQNHWEGAMKKMKGGDTCLQKRSVLQMGWKDKRVVFMSTYDDINGKNSDHSERGQEKEIQKPVCVLNCTKRMGGVDHSDHYCAVYAFICKSPKWWRKLFFWCLEVFIVNSYILYCSCKANEGVKHMSHVKYRRALVENLVGNVREPRERSPEREETKYSTSLPLPL